MNVRGLCQNLKRKQVFQWLKNQNADIFFLQETHLTETLNSQLKHEWGGECVLNGNFRNKEGTAILLNPRSNIVVENHYLIVQKQNSRG